MDRNPKYSDQTLHSSFPNFENYALFLGKYLHCILKYYHPHFGCRYVILRVILLR